MESAPSMKTIKESFRSGSFLQATKSKANKLGRLLGRKSRKSKLRKVHDNQLDIEEDSLQARLNQQFEQEQAKKRGKDGDVECVIMPDQTLRYRLSTMCDI